MSSVSAPAWLQAVPKGTRLAAGATIALSLALSLARTNASRSVPGIGAVLGASNDSTINFPYLVVVPGSVLWYPWTLLTASFCEASLLEFIFSVATIVLSGQYLERVWGQWPFLQFVAVSVIGSNVMAVVVNVLEHFVLADTGALLFGQSYHGMMALQTAFLVAFTQLIPEHQVQLFGGLAKLRVKQLPMLYVTFSNVMVLLGYQSPFILIQFGWLVSWFYLRFVKQNDGVDFRGDRSETFSFASWFPPFLQPYVAKLSRFTFDIAVRVGFLRAWGPTNDPENGIVNSRAEAERKRALALKALDQRMATKPASAIQRGNGSSPALNASAGASSAPPSARPDKGNVMFDANTEEASATPLPKE